MANKRVFYGIQRLDFSTTSAATTLTACHGVQTLGLTLSFNNNPVTQLGNVGTYENIEGVPNVEITVERLLDGYSPAFLLGTRGAANPTLAGRSAVNTVLNLGIWNDTDTSTVVTTALSRAQASGMFASSVGYEFGVDGPFKENCSFVGNNIIWADSYTNAPLVGDVTFDSTWSATDQPFAINGSGGVNEKENIIFTLQNSASGNDSNGTVRDPDSTALPQDIRGISSSGLNPLGSDGFRAARLQRISVRADLGREELFELGHKGAYHRYVNFPVDVTCEIECYSVSGAMVSATEAGVNAGTTGTYCSDRYNTSTRTIRIATCEGLRVYLGKQNRLTNVTQGGGDTGGGNQTITYSYSNQSELTVMHYNDADATLRPGTISKHAYLAVA